MHELGIVFHIADSLLAVGRENNLTSISSVTIELGEVSGVVDSYLTDCWRWTAEKHDLLRGCKMLIETLPAVTLCESCGKTYPTVTYAKVCPFCGSEKTHLETGNEINIKEDRKSVV